MSETISADVAVVGAGPVGLGAALALKALGLSPVVAETAPLATQKAASSRSAALFKHTIAFLRDLGVWQKCGSLAAPIKSLQFIDDTGRLLRAPDCAFSAGEIGEEEFGFNVLNADLAAVLMDEVNARGIRLLTTGPMKAYALKDGLGQLTFADGSTITARLVVAADGRNSALRRAVGLKPFCWAYDQISIAVTLVHEKPHHDRCIEFHRPFGPFTLVPLPGNRSSLIWTEGKEEAERLMALDDASFSREVETVSRFALGHIIAVEERAAFPLAALMMGDFGRDRVALVGEAAHAAPPIGAQGLNLGIRDVAALRDCVKDALLRGQDIGAQGVLRAYSILRRGDVVSRTIGVDLLNKSLLSRFLPLHAARAAGLYALSAVPPLRRAFMRRAIAPAGLF